jgi:hypothetical protein
VLSSNCYKAVVEPWEGAREGGNFEIELPNRLSVARGAKSNATMTQARAAWACFSSRNRQEGVLQLLRMLAATGVLAVVTSSAIAGDVSGAGATFPYPIYAKWADAYKKQTGIAVRYQSVGSGEGIKQIQNKEVTFGASDMPLKAADLDMHGLVQFPTVIGGVVPVVMSRASRRATSRSTAQHWQGSSSARSSHGMTRRFESSIRTSSCRRSQLPWCIAPTVPARPLSSPTTSPR